MNTVSRTASSLQGTDNRAVPYRQAGVAVEPAPVLNRAVGRDAFQKTGASSARTLAAAAQVSFQQVNDPRTRDQKDRDANSAMSGGVVGAVASAPLTTTGLNVALHEYSHAAAFKLLYGSTATVQVDGFENFARMKEAKTLRDGLIAAGNWLTGADTHQDGAAGWASASTEKLTPLGKQFGPELSDALVSLAGTIGTELPLFPLYALGSHARDRHPFMGYSLMTLSLTMHALNMGYAWDAALMSRATMEQRAAHGHDFANAALQIAKHYHMDPTIVSKIIAGGFTASLPAFALALHLWNKGKGRTGDDLIPEAVALAHLYRQAETDRALADRLNRLLEHYPQHQALARAERVMDAWMASPLDRLDKRVLKPASDNLTDQVKALNNYLIREIPDEIRAARVDLRRQFGLATGQDTFEKAMEAASVGSMGAMAVCGTLAPLAVAARLTSVVGRTLPLLAAIPMAGTYYQTVKDLQNPQLNATAKKCSLASSVAAGAGFVAMVGTLALPGLGLPLLALGLGQGVVQGILARRRQQAIRRQIIASVYPGESPPLTAGDKISGVLSRLKKRLVG